MQVVGAATPCLAAPCTLARLFPPVMFCTTRLTVNFSYRDGMSQEKLCILIYCAFGSGANQSRVFIGIPSSVQVAANGTDVANALGKEMIIVHPSDLHEVRGICIYYRDPYYNMTPRLMMVLVIFCASITLERSSPSPQSRLLPR